MKYSDLRDFVQEQVEIVLYEEEGRLEQEFTEEGVYDQAIFKAIFLAGGPGSGKSYTAGRVTSGMGFTVINSDDVLEWLAERDGSTESVRAADMVGSNEAENVEIDEIRARAKRTITAKYNLQIGNRKGVIIDGTGSNADKIIKQSDSLRELGYDTKMIFVNTSLDTALERNRARSRRVTDSIVNKSWQAVQNNIGKFQHYFGRNNFSIIDNNTAINYGDRVIRQEIADDLWVDIRDFVNQKPRNEIAHNWIENELYKKQLGIRGY